MRKKSGFVADKVFFGVPLLVGLFLALGLSLFPYIYKGAPEALSSKVINECQNTDQKNPCIKRIAKLNDSRYRLELDSDNAQYRIDLELETPRMGPLFLAIRAADSETNFLIEPQIIDENGPSDGFEIVSHRNEKAAPRVVYRYTGNDKIELITILFTAQSKQLQSETLVIEELAVFGSAEGVLSGYRPYLTGLTDGEFGRLMRIVSVILFILGLAAILLKTPAPKHSFLVALLVATTFFVATFELYYSFSPSQNDLRVFMGPTLFENNGSNLNYGPAMGIQLLRGKGFTFADEAIHWARMPGYAVFTAVAGAFSESLSLVEVKANTVVVHVLFWTFAVGLFSWFSLYLFSPHVVALIGGLAIFSPKQLAYTQIESIMAGVALLILAALCAYLSAFKKGQVRFRHHVAVHLGFALWFSLRPDILPGWFVASLMLHYRAPRGFLIPLMLFLAIGLSWGLYKKQYIGEFSMTTTSVGASSFCGLWEVPSNFVWQPLDGDYFAWMEENNKPPTRKDGSAWAFREVRRFWMTYPVYMVSLVWHEFVNFVRYYSWPGLYDIWSFKHLRGWPMWCLLTGIFLSLLTGFERRRTLLLGWAFFFNLPIFFLVYSSGGRFYAPASLSVIVATVPLFLDKNFYRAIWKHRIKAALILAMTLILASGVDEQINTWLIQSEARYASPFLDPAESTLNRFASPKESGTN